MELKKHDKVNLERKRPVFLQIGFIVAIGISLAAFEWEVPDDTTHVYQNVIPVEVLQEQLPITRQKVLKAPLPKPFVTEELVLMDDPEEEEEEEEDAYVFDSEATDDHYILMFDEPEPEHEEPLLFVIVEKMPEFDGGLRALKRHLARKTRYPNLARENNIQGKVFVRFLITDSGTVAKAKVARSVHPLLDKEALRVVNNLPIWTPGEQNGKLVNVWHTLPITFLLQR